VQQNAGAQGTALDDAVAARNWDPSVQSLTAFPQVLAMMSDKLEWTERLGDAFLADQARVMDTVQALRRRAEAAGNLASTPQQTVVDDNGAVVIGPAQPDVVYVPVYDPTVVYGPWWAPGYVPWFWYPPPIYGYPAIVTGIAFGLAWPIWPDHWGWGRPDWQGRHVVLDVGHNRFWNRPNRPALQPGQRWQHAPFHRRGVPYADMQTRERYQPSDPGGVRGRQVYRGYVPPAVQPGVAAPGRRIQNAPETRPVTPAPRTAAPAGASRVNPSIFDPGNSREQAHINAQRGMQSLQSRPAAPASPVIRAPSSSPTPAPSAPALRAPPAPVMRAPSNGVTRMPASPTVPRGR
jgi:hypothetical protein